MDIDMKELEAFTAVVERGSFSRAAESLFLSQPTISAHVASLERKLNVKLLVRTTREIYPTDAGDLFYNYAAQILRLRTAAVEAIETFRMEMRGTIQIAASTIPGQYYLPKLIQDFRVKCPDINFNLQILDSREVTDRIASRRAELGFTGAVVPQAKCVYDILTEDQLVLITPNSPRYRDMAPDGYPLQDITRETFICREPGSGTRMETERFFRQLGILPQSLHIAVEVRSNESIKQLVRAGLGVAILSRSACRDDLKLGQLLCFELGGTALHRKLYLVRHKNAVLSPICQAFYDFAAAYYQGTETPPSPP